MGGAAEERWTPARVEEALFARLAALESRVASLTEEANARRDELDAVEAKGVRTGVELVSVTAAASAAKNDLEAAARAETTKTRGEIDEVRALVAERDAAIVALERDVAKAAKDAKSLEALRLELAESKRALETREEQLAAARSSLESSTASSAEALAVARAETDAIRDELDSARTALAEEREKNAAVDPAAYDAARLDLDAARAEAASLSAKLAEKEAALAEYRGGSGPVAKLSRWTAGFLSGFRTDDVDPAAPSTPLSERLEALIEEKTAALAALEGTRGVDEIASEMSAVGDVAAEIASLEAELVDVRDRAVAVDDARVAAKKTQTRSNAHSPTRIPRRLLSDESSRTPTPARRRRRATPTPRERRGECASNRAAAKDQELRAALSRADALGLEKRSVESSMDRWMRAMTLANERAKRSEGDAARAAKALLELETAKAAAEASLAASKETWETEAASLRARLADAERVASSAKATRRRRV